MEEHLEMLQREKRDLLDYINVSGPNDEQYFNHIKAVGEVQKLIDKEYEQTQRTKKRKWWEFTPEQQFDLFKLGFITFTNGAMVWYITKYEEFHNWTSKALNFINKPKM